jgi:magnesium chelatase family protein
VKCQWQSLESNEKANRPIGRFHKAYHRILKLARTIADLAGNERIEAAHLAEAVQYRPRQML